MDLFFSTLNIYILSGISLVSHLPVPLGRACVVYRMTQFLGNPQGPLSGLSSVSGFVFVLFWARVSFFPSAAAVAVPVPAAGAAAVSSFFSPLALPSSHAAPKLTLLTWSQNPLPWAVASSISRALGWRLPSPDAKVPAPQGEPPRTSSRALWIWKVVA